MKEIRVFHVRRFISDKRSRTNSIRSPCCLWLWESQPMLCLTINVFYLFWGNAHLSPPPRPLRGHLGNPAGTHAAMATGTLPGCGVPIIPPAARQICLQTGCRCRALGGSRRPFFQAAPGSVSSQLMSLSFLIPEY